ncbi:MAG: glycerol-3-phosphate 1-O-acyltransferase PlsY [Candidatus Omnitrophica bacterium]|nr:glycerol-3-phosphate 1-O-acyltransferase PlsY [Candidatus Omnitrophota bacterium]MDD5653808.1 glycerol-3-phosphate 1-O-acyltransferase PlsY [Candidatus Omnitrophota bacterium]
MQWIVLAVIISYLIGSIPTAYLFGKIFKGVDIRNFGSGNVGATNALRVFGKRAGAIVLLLDIIKGILPVVFLADYVLLRSAAFSADALRFIIGLVCICGHNWTVFLKFKGGKGVATSLGVLIGLSLKIYIFAKILGIVILVWLVSFLIARIVSFSSLLAAIAFPAAVFFFKLSLPMQIFSLLACVFIILRHRTNLVRLFQGKEPRLRFKKS